MAINKSNSPAWVKVVVILVAVSFVAAFIPLVIQGFSGGGGGGQSATPNDAGSFAAKYQPAIDAGNAALQANPENSALLTQQGHNYYEWAAELSNNSLFDAALPLWLTAVDFYDKSLALEPDNPVVLGNRGFALFYSQDPRAREALEAFVAINEPTLAQQVQAARDMLTQLASVPATGSASATAAP